MLTADEGELTQADSMQQIKKQLFWNLMTGFLFYNEHIWFFQYK